MEKLDFLALASADLVDRAGVFFVDDRALDLEGWGHFAFVDGELAREQIDAFDALVIREFATQINLGKQNVDLLDSTKA